MKLVTALFALAAVLVVAPTLRAAQPLKVAYSDWPGWVAWEIAIQKDWFKEEGVDVLFEWFEYVPSMEAFAANQVDAVAMTNGDALVTGATGARSRAILINDYSNGNDMIVARSGINHVRNLKGRKIGVEVGFVTHLLLLKALETNGMNESDVTLVNVPTHETPQALASGDVDAIVAWQPNSGQALKALAGARAIYTSADAPGLIYDVLAVNPASLSARRADWQKVVKVWYRVVDYLNDPATRDDAVKLMAARVSLPPASYQEFLEGTRILSLDEAKQAFRKGPGLDSIYGSSEAVDRFNVANKVYTRAQRVNDYLDSSFTEALK